MKEYVPGISRVLAELSFSREDDECDIGITENGDLMSFLQQSRPPFWESHLPIDLVLYPLQRHPSSSHFSGDRLPSLSLSLSLSLTHTNTWFLYSYNCIKPEMPVPFNTHFNTIFPFVVIPPKININKIINVIKINEIL